MSSAKATSTKRAKPHHLVPIENGTLDHIKRQARDYSIAHPGMYVIVVDAFGPFIVARPRFGVYTPTDTPLDCYWLNGREKKFTQRQIIADQLATPTLS